MLPNVSTKIMSTFQLNSDHFLVDPKYILSEDQEDVVVRLIDKHFKEGEPLQLELPLQEGITVSVILFRPYAGSQTYIYSKNDLYVNALPCDSEFLMLLPMSVATKLKKFDSDLGVVLPQNPAGVTIEKGKLFSGIHSVKSFEVE